MFWFSIFRKGWESTWKARTYFFHIPAGWRNIKKNMFWFLTFLQEFNILNGQTYFLNNHLSWWDIKNICSCSQYISQDDGNLPDGPEYIFLISQDDILDISPSRKTQSDPWYPSRNSIFLRGQIIHFLGIFLGWWDIKEICSGSWYSPKMGICLRSQKLFL